MGVLFISHVHLFCGIPRLSVGLPHLVGSTKIHSVLKLKTFMDLLVLLVKWIFQLTEKERESTMLKEAVLENDIASIVSKWTGVPVDSMLASVLQIWWA